MHPCIHILTKLKQKNHHSNKHKKITSNHMRNKTSLNHKVKKQLTVSKNILTKTNTENKPTHFHFLMAKNFHFFIVTSTTLPSRRAVRRQLKYWKIARAETGITEGGNVSAKLGCVRAFAGLTFFIDLFCLVTVRNN